MKKVTKSKIPDFKNYAEEAEFWDTHDITDFLDEAKEVKINFKAKEPKEETVIVRLQKPMKQRLQGIADEMGLSLSTMLRTWMIEKMRMLDSGNNCRRM